MQRRPTIFFDFDDTLSDPIPFFLQFAQESGSRFHATFGGEVKAWEKGMADMLISIEEEYKRRFVGNPTNGYLDWLHGLRTSALPGLFDTMNVPLPPEVERLFIETQFASLCNCDAAFPGAHTALKTLAEQGYTLHMASGQESTYLRGSLTGMGLLNYFGHLFGPDLIDCAKEGPEYYARAFAAVGVRPEEAIVVDDYPPAIQWAVATGAKVIQVQLSPMVHQPIQAGIVALVTRLRDLPWQVDRILKLF